MVETQEKNCVFCKIVRGEILSDKVVESDNFIVIRDANPISKGHYLVIPKKHFVNLLDIPVHFGSEMLDLMKKSAINMIDNDLGEGFNVLMNNFGVAGQEVMHAHMHIISREKGDNLELISKK